MFVISPEVELVTEHVETYKEFLNRQELGSFTPKHKSAASGNCRWRFCSVDFLRPKKDRNN